MSIQPGQKAPAFTLVSSDKKEVSLKDFEGKNVVLLFFPMAFSSVCTEELCAMRDDIANYEKLNAEVLAASVDSPFVLAKFKEDQHLNFTLLSDFNKEACRAYGAFHEEFVFGLKGVAQRSAFVIDKEGVVRYAEITESPGIIPDFIAVKKALEELN